MVIMIANEMMETRIRRVKMEQGVHVVGRQKQLLFDCHHQKNELGVSKSYEDFIWFSVATYNDGSLTYFLCVTTRLRSNYRLYTYKTRAITAPNA